jgi:hypothetical protein
MGRNSINNSHKIIKMTDTLKKQTLSFALLHESEHEKKN